MATEPHLIHPAYIGWYVKAAVRTVMHRMSPPMIWMRLSPKHKTVLPPHPGFDDDNTPYSLRARNRPARPLSGLCTSGPRQEWSALSDTDSEGGTHDTYRSCKCDSVANKQDTRTTAAPTDPQDAASRRATDPNVIQQRASDPASSVWMSASAGSGKTKVLVDRLLRLFLPDQDGHGATPPHRILCLTFTKAGASEMAIRINKVLGEWAIAADTDLQRRSILLGYAPTDQQKMIARHLFKVLDAPGGRNATIHAFCQSVLSRFPLKPV